MSDESFERVLDFWLGELDEDGRADGEHQARWWKKDPAFDREIRERFLADYEALARGERASWLESPRGRVAAVIVLDQFSRNMFRDTPRMYEQDHRALALAEDSLDLDQDRALGYHERYFLYMPFMHAEDRACQARCVELFRAMKDDFPALADKVDVAIGFADRHAVIVERFGRFPHRNELLGRQSTPEEVAFLEEPGSSF